MLLSRNDSSRIDGKAYKFTDRSKVAERTCKHSGNRPNDKKSVPYQQNVYHNFLKYGQFEEPYLFKVLHCYIVKIIFDNDVTDIIIIRSSQTAENQDISFF